MHSCALISTLDKNKFLYRKKKKFKNEYGIYYRQVQAVLQVALGPRYTYVCQAQQPKTTIEQNFLLEHVVAPTFCHNALWLKMLEKNATTHCGKQQFPISTIGQNSDKLSEGGGWGKPYTVPLERDGDAVAQCTTPNRSVASALGVQGVHCTPSHKIQNFKFCLIKLPIIV